MSRKLVLEPTECDICPTHAIMAIFKTNHPNNYHRLCTRCKDDLESEGYKIEDISNECQSIL